jgi:hypothetical protein
MIERDEILLNSGLPLKTNPQFKPYAARMIELEKQIQATNDERTIRKLTSELNYIRKQTKTMGKFMFELQPSSTASISGSDGGGSGSVYRGQTGLSQHEAKVWAAALSIASDTPQRAIQSYFDFVGYPMADQVVAQAMMLQDGDRKLGFMNAAYKILGAFGYDQFDTMKISPFDAFMKAQELSANYSTVTLGSILDEVANINVFAGWSATQAGLVGLRLCRQISSSNFKESYSVSLTSDELLQQVGPSGEVKHAALDTDRYPYRVSDWARTINLSYQDLVNNSADVLTNSSRLLGSMAARTVEQEILRLLVNAPSVAGAGTDEYFITANNTTTMKRKKNFIQGAGTLDATTLAAAIAALRGQVSKESDQPLSYSPTYLLVSDSNATIGRQLTNQYSGAYPGLQVLESSWLHSPLINPAASPTSWFVVHASDIGSPFIAAFLDGVNRPTIQRGTKINLLGVQMRCVLPFGVAYGDPRCIVKCET